MGNCRYKKRLQIYLDGWLDNSEAGALEAHLKKCPVCQNELIEMEEVASAALEIIDEAPDSGYWESFYSRTINRIISRDVTPYQPSEKPKRGFLLKIGSYSLAIVSIAASIVLLLNYFPGVPDTVLNSPADSPVANNSPLIENSAEGVQKEQVFRTVGDVSVLRENIAEVIDIELVRNPTGASETAPEYVSTVGDLSRPEKELSNFEANYASYFRGNLLTFKAHLDLAGGSAYESNFTESYYDQIGDNYSLNSAMIAAGILPASNGQSGLGSVYSGETAVLGFGDILNRNFGDWGYLSMPSDTGSSKEIRRFLIELELIQTK